MAGDLTKIRRDCMPNKVIECHCQTRARCSSEELGLCVRKTNLWFHKIVLIRLKVLRAWYLRLLEKLPFVRCLIRKLARPVLFWLRFGFCQFF